jgi:hypothetical protein
MDTNINPDFPIPTMIDNTPVSYLETQIMEINGLRYITLWPDDDNDFRLWEFCLDNGKIYQAIK